MNPSETTILVVDDEPDLRDGIAFDFESKGFNIETAGTGKEALDILRAKKVDLVLSDVRMPDIDGLTLLDKIKATNITLPVVIFITGYTDISLEEAYDRGVDAVFPKPIDRKALYDSVVRALQPMDIRYQRNVSRLTSQLPIRLNFLKSKISVDATASNIGRGGMFTSINGRLPEISEEVEFRIETTTHPKLNLSGLGIVRWVRTTPNAESPTGCGIEFLSFDSECLKGAIELINFLKTKSFIPQS